MDTDSEPKLMSLLSQMLSPSEDMHPDVISLMIQIVCLVSAMDFESQPQPESELMSLIRRAISIFNSMDLDSQPEPLSKLIYLLSHNISLDNSFGSELKSEFESLLSETLRLDPKPELISFLQEASALLQFQLLKAEQKSEGDLERELISLISELLHNDMNDLSRSISIIFAVSSMDSASQPMPQSELMLRVTQAIYVFNSMDMENQPQPLSNLISLINEAISLVKSTYQMRQTRYDFPDELEERFKSLIQKTLDLEPEPELISLMYQIFSLGFAQCTWWKDYISVCPQVQLGIEQGKIYEQVPLRSNKKWDCLLPAKWEMFSERTDAPFLCYSCHGENHQEYKQAPVAIKHPFHPKHSLQLAFLARNSEGIRCCCCHLVRGRVLYYCSRCKFSIDFDCVDNPPVLSIDHPKWHEHKLALFSRITFLTCDVCALIDSTCPLYICPPCGFVAHQSCLTLPRVIRISRHHHRISFVHSFGRGDWSCGVCRRKIDNDYGGYSCIKEGCSYGVHSKCATQENVWDGVDLEGVPEEVEEELEPPFLRISDGTIQHFSHEHHHMKLDENTTRDYNENQLCQACVTPVHYGNLYYCLQCDDFILHEKCANLSRKQYNPIHPHLLTLVTNDIDVGIEKKRCSACPWRCTGFYYKCCKEGCNFRVHVDCATISEPLDHESHRHPLFLTSKPGERRRCRVCNDSRRSARGVKHSLIVTADETFNCIEECDFSLCFGCATLPQKLRYKHDKHMLTLSYEEGTNTMVYWCEVCEKKINRKERFYKCDEYCCVTLHIECLVENGLYMKHNVRWWTYSTGGLKTITVKANNHRMSRPFCDGCGDGKRCPYNFYFISNSHRKFCSITCLKSH